MVASENDALPKAKVGGIGDVIRDIPPALAQAQCQVHVVIPSHGFLHKQAGASRSLHFPVAFGGELLDVGLYKLSASATKRGHLAPGVFQWVIHHELMDPDGSRSVYVDDGKNKPFATDATKYALFCAAVGQALLQSAFGELDVVHLHDWHSAFLAILRAYDVHYKKLGEIPVVYTIHNLSLQGVRPFKGDDSSLDTWFPNLKYDKSLICDPAVTHCVNPMRAAIELADKVHAVSPTYAKEIQKASDPERLLVGGEGLECVLQTAAKQGRLVGILNGCEYPEVKRSALPKAKLGALIHAVLMQWASKSEVLKSAHWVAERRLNQWLSKKERGILATSVGRLTAQKVALFQQRVTVKGHSHTVLDALLSSLGNKGILVLLGSGDPEIEAFILEVCGRHSNLIFLQGYSEPLADALYSSGDVFLMPSSFEPCGISQMLAMRAGQPCIVHGVGGLNDTVKHKANGFVFNGKDGARQSEQFLITFQKVLKQMKDDAKGYGSIGKAAAEARFSWSSAAQSYITQLY